jgi:hypothetical protein
MMSRSLRISPRPFIAFAVVLSPIVVIWMLVLWKNGFRSDLILPGLLPFLLYGVVMTVICSRMVSVDGDSVTVTSFFVRKQSVPFSEIERSDLQYLGERDFPISIRIHAQGGRSIMVRLKPFEKVDVAWFCALPHLKAVAHRGFTRAV